MPTSVTVRGRGWGDEPTGHHHMTDSNPVPIPGATPRRLWPYLVITVVTALATFAVTALLINIFTRKSEERVAFVRVAAVDEATTDPATWGRNWPRQHDSYQRTVDVTHTRYGGSDAMPAQKLDRDPWLRRMYSGYAFALDYRDRRGHAYMLADQEQTERVTKRPQPGACLHCHASVVPTWRRLGAQALGEPVLTNAFQWPAVEKGFELASIMSYAAAHAELVRTGDGSGGTGKAHPVACLDCHDPATMELRVSRPGFLRGIRGLAASDAEVPHLPSVTRWRQGNRKQPYDPNVDATRQEMRAFVCGQCHVEYYCGPKEVMFFPWSKGLKVEQIEAFYEEHRFPDGSPFHDWKHGETGALVYKAQHPEFELWSQGVHARSGVACADCHMPYVREGAMKVSDHWVRSPLLMVNRSCQTCHSFPEAELEARVTAIQDRTRSLIDRAAVAMTDMLDAIRAAQAAGVAPAEVSKLLALQRRAQWRLDFVSSENSIGFHADQESARILAEAIDYARQAQAFAAGLRAPAAPPASQPAGTVEGVTPAERSPPAPYGPPGGKR
jgi:nitrite reductase (cytochrome c-552)